MITTVFKYLIAFTILFVIVSVIIYAIRSPSNNRQWSFGNSHPARVDINQQHVSIHNFRDVDWEYVRPDKEIYSTLEFELTDIQSLKLVVSHFAPLSEIAHILILFELKDKTQIGLSVEARKEVGEQYSLSGGLSAKFELIYVFATYRDLVELRLMREEAVHIYPIKASPEEAQSLFKAAAKRTNDIENKPELYHLFIKNCTTEIVRLVKEIGDFNFPRLVQSFTPGDSGKTLYKMGLIDSEAKSFEAVQEETLVRRRGKPRKHSAPQ